MNQQEAKQNRSLIKGKNTKIKTRQRQKAIKMSRKLRNNFAVEVVNVFQRRGKDFKGDRDLMIP